MSKYCPNCIEKLVPQTKKLGACTKWNVCPICGYRERPLTENSNSIQNFIDRNRGINNSNHFREY